MYMKFDVRLARTPDHRPSYAMEMSFTPRKAEEEVPSGHSLSETAKALVPCRAVPQRAFGDPRPRPLNCDVTKLPRHAYQ